MDLRETWAALDQGRAVAAALIVPAAGRSGMVFVSGTPLSSTAATLAQLLRVAADHQNPARMALLQALLDPGQQRESQALQDAGFQALATLLYQQHDIGPTDAPLDLADHGLTVSRWSRRTRHLFERAILGSYEQTLDCPGLVGLRDVHDIIEGHMSSGMFTPDLWFVVHQGDEPAGVMLLNTSPQRQAIELVYLGLTVPFRGMGLGRRLVRHALAQGYERGAATMQLAVDQSNTPALSLYRSLGFETTAQKEALIRVCRGPAAD